MSALINRVPTGRIISLVAELKYLDWRFGKAEFTLNEMKLDNSLEKTQLDFFPLAVKHKTYGRYNGKFDPYLDNPLDKAGFHLTQSVERDSQKSKAVSECFSALEGLGWINRTNDNKGKLSEIGIRIASLKYDGADFYQILKSSLLGYGPLIGLLWDSSSSATRGVVKRSDILIGYPNTGETLTVNGNDVPLSTGSQDDSITRTRSALIAWAMTVGFLWPSDLKVPQEDYPKEALKLLKDKKWTWNNFTVNLDSKLFSEKKIYVERPISYKWLTKSTKALRERGQGDIRGATMDVEDIIKNRRFALVYTLALASADDSCVNFNNLLTLLKQYPDHFVIDEDEFENVMNIEMEICTTVGIPYIDKNGCMEPLTLCNLEVLSFGASQSLIDILDDIYKQLVENGE